MVLQTELDPGEWKSIFTEENMTVTSAMVYTQIFASEKLTRDSLPMMDSSMLKELDFKTMGEMLAKLKLVKDPPPVSPLSQTYYLKKIVQNFPNSTWKWQHNNCKSSE